MTEIVTLSDQGRLHVSWAADPIAVLVLGHGAGGGVDVTDLAWLAADLPAYGITVVRHEQPWRALGGKVAWPPARLDEGWAPAVREVARRWPDLPTVTGGRSAGARVACRGSANPSLPPVAGVVTLAFPLHLPGKPERSRLAELVGVPVPVLAFAGERDTFGTPQELEMALADAGVAGRWDASGAVPEAPGDRPRGPAAGGRNRLVVIPGAGHSLVPAAKVLPRDDVRRLLVSHTASFVTALAAGPGGSHSSME